MCFDEMPLECIYIFVIVITILNDILVLGLLTRYEYHRNIANVYKIFCKCYVGEVFAALHKCKEMLLLVN